MISYSILHLFASYMSLNAFRLVLSAPFGECISLFLVCLPISVSPAFLQIVVLIFSHFALKTQNAEKSVSNVCRFGKSTNFASSNEIQHVCKTFGIKEMTQ